MSALKRKSETCEEQLRRMCKNIAEEISAGPQQVNIHTGEDREEVTASSWMEGVYDIRYTCLLYTSPSPRDGLLSRMPSSA